MRLSGKSKLRLTARGHRYMPWQAQSFLAGRDKHGGSLPRILDVLHGKWEMLQTSGLKLLQERDVPVLKKIRIKNRLMYKNLFRRRTSFECENHFRHQLPDLTIFLEPNET